MKDWEKTLVSKDLSIREVIKVINDGALQIALVIDLSNRLLGTVTDGDVRRGILGGVSLDDPVHNIMFCEPTTVNVEASHDEIMHIFQQSNLHQIPVIDSAGKVVGLELIDSLIKPAKRENWVVIMAGGLGSRLRPLTENCPKPMLEVGGQPILETILINFKKNGFSKFFFSVNYMSEIIEEHFGDGSSWDCEIIYLYEDEPLGTAGSLSLLPDHPLQPLIVMNGDVLTKVDFPKLLEFHSSHKTLATMCVREFDMQVPYGVVIADELQFKSIEEKPIQKFFVNAGIYVLDPEVLSHVPPNRKFDMPQLFELLHSKSLISTVFPVMEYWLDLGRIEDLARAKGEFTKVFK